MVTFQQYLGTPLYLDDSGNASEPGFIAFYLSIQGNDPPTQIEIDEAWTSYIGFFLFLEESPSEENLNAFVAQIGSYLDENAPSPDHTGFAWVTWDDGNVNLGTVRLVTAAPNATDPGAVIIGSDTLIDMGLFQMDLGENGPIVTTLSTADGSITSFTFEYPPEADTPEPVTAYNIQVPMTGDLKGTFQGQLTLSNFSSTGSWNVDLNYVINNNGTLVNQSYPVFADQDGTQVLMDFVIDPLDFVNPDRTYLLFTGEAFRLEEVDGTLTIVLDSTVMASNFRTIYGETVYLDPLTDGDDPAKLVYDYKLGEDGTKTLYLCPSGDFEFQMEGGALATEKQFQLLCGLSGAENFSFRPKSISRAGDVMRFQPYQAAYAPRFPLIEEADTSLAIPQPDRKHNLAWKTKGKAVAGASLSTELLDSTYTTAWINVRPPASASTDNLAIDAVPTYYSQPKDAALYDHQAVSSSLDVEESILALRNTPAALFTALVDQSVPQVPYAGASASAELGANGLRNFEEQVIGPERREQVSAIDASAQLAGIQVQADLVQTTTPQGLIANVPVAGLDWDSVLLAKSESAGDTYDLKFQNGVTTPLRNALQSNQLFLVATEAEALGDFANEITIADWPFTFNVGSNGTGVGQYANILIFKFCVGSLEDRLGDPASWNQASTFNGDPDLVAFSIQTFIANTRINAESDDSYDNFLRIISDENWNGILALKVDVSVQNFPEDLKGLLAGIDRSEFFAHHIGIEINYVEPKDGVLELPQSSMFGLIDYVAKGAGNVDTLRNYDERQRSIDTISSSSSPLVFNPPEEGIYGFSVLKLKVQFLNSDISNYASQIQFTSTSWFGAIGNLRQINAGDSLKQQTMIFNGAYESHNGVRTYSFSTEPGEVYQYFLESGVMRYLTVVKAQFNTLNSEIQGEGTENITTAFSFWGYLNFFEFQGFDLFSFGNENNQGSQQAGLYFSGLKVEMEFTLDADGNTNDQVFQLNPESIAFDASLSTPRVDSVYNKFPITIAGFMYAEGAGVNLADQGFLTVNLDPAEDLNSTGLTEGEWYALVYTINLGSMGGLAAQAGFTAQLVTAWSPGSNRTERPIFTGIKLPGVGGGQKTLSLQTVLNLSIDTVTWKSMARNGDLSDLAYLMTLDDIKLRILGKKLPGAASTTFTLFGDPEGNDLNSLAWYAAYYNPPTE